MKKIALYFLCTVLITGVAGSCGSKSKTENANITETTDQKSEGTAKPAPKKYQELAEATNAMLPMPIPGGIRIDKAEAISDKVFKFHYTFTQDPVVKTEEFVKSAKLPLAVLLREGKGVDIEMFRDDKMTVIYAYYTMDGTLFAEIKLTPDDYLK